MPSRRLRQLPAAPPPPDLTLPDPAAAANVSERGGSSRRTVVVPAVVATGICLVFFAALAFAIYRVGRRRKSAVVGQPDFSGVEVAKENLNGAEISSALPAPPPPPPPPPKEPHRFPYEELRRATSSFAPSNKLGQGGFGPVFRGVLGDGREVAVKVMEDGSLQGEREFRNELALASTLMQGADISGDPSRFVVSCIGFCSDDDDAGAPGGSGKGKSKKKKKRKKRSKRVEEEDDKWGFRGRRRGRSISSALTEDEEGSISCGEDRQSGRRLLLVYELMRNGSLQDALLDRKCQELMEWSHRFSIALDVAKGIEFLHTACDPPVIHGDVKPSNILLDVNFSAKIADFGLARILIPTAIHTVEDDASVAIADDHSMTAAETESIATTALDEMSNCISTQAGTTRSAGAGPHGTVSAAAIPKVSPDEYEAEIGGSMRLTEGGELSPIAMAASQTMEAGSTSEVGGAYDKMSVDSGVELLTPGGRRWWKKKDNVAGNAETADFVGRPTVKDYVMEWIGTELRKETPKASWADASASKLDGDLAVSLKKSDRKKHQKRLEWLTSLDERWLRKKGKNRPAREWWREEFCEELTRKNMKKKKQSATRSTASFSGVGKEKQWWERDDDLEVPSFRRNSRKAWSRGSKSSLDRLTDGLSGELKMAGRVNSHDWGGGDIPKSGGMSSTPSMRGTVCYAAPEYGGGGLLSEKCDIYSFGVLLLVLISGRRPLQVTVLPMADFERANLISWARHLAHTGKLMDLVDVSLQFVDKDQALLCITIALLCLQRSPANRPMIREVVGMLLGESEPPHLPLEFSPSPPSGFPYKSRRRAR